MKISQKIKFSQTLKIARIIYGHPVYILYIYITELFHNADTVLDNQVKAVYLN